MKTIELWRVASSLAGMQGVLKYDYKVFALTLELPWRDNKRGESCIPSGCYKVDFAPSAARGGKKIWWVRDVSGRDAIQIHTGNIVEHTEGCIIIGDQFDIESDGGIFIKQSRYAYSELMGLCGADAKFLLTVKDKYL
jgi:hypothetical protein